MSTTHEQVVLEISFEKGHVHQHIQSPRNFLSSKIGDVSHPKLGLFETRKRSFLEIRNSIMAVSSQWLSPSRPMLDVGNNVTGIASIVAPEPSYATIASDGTEDYSHLRWPDAPQGHRHPTPYQIFCLQQTDAYSKQRFYELVKLYHPDRSGSQPTDSSILPATHPCRNIPPTTKLERYRLIIAAHGILSDPEKRRAYDSFGAGWSGMPDAVTPSNNWGRATAHGSTRPGPFSGWREHSDPDIWGNATWEDWERFYARRDPTHPSYQAPQYLRNSYFITVVMMLALLGSSANYGRAEKNGEHFLEARDAMHDRASKELRKVRQQSESRHKEERIQFFLRQREATMMGVGVEDVRRDRLAKLLPEQEGCMPEDLRSKDWEDETRSDDP